MRDYVKSTLAQALGCDESDLDEKFVELIVYVLQGWSGSSKTVKENWRYIND